jgi:hypothetical protein
MSNILAFPARTSRYVNPPSYWRTYKVYAVDTNGDHHVLTYRALSVDSAHCRARRDGFNHINKIEVQADDK